MSYTPSDLVIVVDHRRQFLESVPAAIARTALRAKKAKILFKKPFTIQLVQGLLRCPRPKTASEEGSREGGGKKQGRKESEVIVTYGVIMTNTNANLGANFNSKNPVLQTKAIDEYFASNPHQIWVKATTDMQVVISSRDRNKTVAVPPVQPGDPVLLTRYATVEELKSSDLRDLVMRRKLRLMTEDEALNYFEAKAKRMGASLDEVQLAAEEKQRALLNREPLTSPTAGKKDQTAIDIMARKMPSQELSMQASINPELIADIIKPKVRHICGQASMVMKPEDRKPANMILEELIAIEDSLSHDDLEFIIANVGYKTVKNWATERQAALMQ